MVKKLKNYIAGKWVAPRTKEFIDSIDPFTERVLSKVPVSTKADVDKAVRAAKKAQQDWRLVPAPKRAEYIYKITEVLQKRKKALATLCTKEMGKPIAESLGDVQEAIDIGRLMAGEGRRLFGQTIASELPDKDMRSVRMPVGVFALITPWNFPIAIPGWKIFPALVAGNTVVFKPSNYTSQCGVEFVKCVEEAGLPPGVLNLVLGKGSVTGDALVEHPGIQGISFTGSAAVGREIGASAGGRLLKHHLEMGGKNACIVMDDADLDLAVDGCIWAGFGTSGQRCTAGSRIIVHKKVHEEFLRRFIRRAKKLKVGDGQKPSTQVGPMVNKDALEKVERYMRIAKEKDKVTFALGGKRIKTKKGYFFQPTVLTGVKPHHVVAQEEIFGPVVSVLKATSFADAIRIANDVDYGLSNAIFTQDVNRAFKAARDLQSGLVYVNNATIGAEIGAPFGGIKNTGNGHREAGGLGGAVDSYTEIKVINVDYSGSIQKAQQIKWATK